VKDCHLAGMYVCTPPPTKPGRKILDFQKGGFSKKGALRAQNLLFYFISFLFYFYLYFI
jgi:hypothetical protein